MLTNLVNAEKFDLFVLMELNKQPLIHKSNDKTNKTNHMSKIPNTNGEQVNQSARNDQIPKLEH